VLLTSALRNEGIDGVIDEIEKHKSFQSGSGLLKKKKEKRIEEEFSEIIKELMEIKIARRLGDAEIKKIYARVKSGELDPYEGAELVISKIM
jgi:LAO/AO transport system kinase